MAAPRWTPPSVAFNPKKNKGKPKSNMYDYVGGQHLYPSAGRAGRGGKAGGTTTYGTVPQSGGAVQGTPEPEVDWHVEAEREADRIVTELLAELGYARDSARREAESAAQAEIRRAQALAQALTSLNMPGMIQGVYQNSSQSLAGLAQGFSGSIKGLADTGAAEQANMVAGTGQEGAIRNEGQAMSDVNYGLHGFIPARGLEQTGAAFAANAALQPGFALQFGNMKASDVMADYIKNVLPKFTDDEAKIRSKRSELISDAEERYLKAKDDQRGEALDLYNAGFLTARQLARELGYPNWKKYPNTLKGEKGAGQPEIDWVGSKALHYLVDDFGNAILDTKGKKIPLPSDPKDRKTKTIQLNNGQDVLIDQTTGAVIKVFGSPDQEPPVMRGSPSTGYDYFDPVTGEHIGHQDPTYVKPTTGDKAKPVWKQMGFKSQKAMEAAAHRLATEAKRGKKTANPNYGVVAGAPQFIKEDAMDFQDAWNYLLSENIPPNLAWKVLKGKYPNQRRPAFKPAGGPTNASGGGGTTNASYKTVTNAGFTASADVVSTIVTAAKKYGLDANAVMAVALAEGGLTYGAVGDNGTSYGPFQLHVGGALPRGKNAAWANSPAGIDYALRKMSAAAKGLRGQAAIDAIVRKFERPADPSGEVARALGYYQRMSRQGGAGANTVSYGGSSPGGAVQELFYDPAPRSYDQGNWIGPIGNHSDHVHVSLGDVNSAVKIIRKAQQMGLRVGENPYVDPVDGNHVEGSFHYQTLGTYKGKTVGAAIDVSGSSAKMRAFFEWVKRQYLVGGQSA